MKKLSNCYEYVDLGLPSGLLWATCNVGASKPEESGLFFQWGSTIGHNGEIHTDWTTAPFNHGLNYFDEETPLKSFSEVLNKKYELREQNDAVHTIMGGKWRMPTKEECEELVKHTTSIWIKNYNNSGVSGRLFISNINGETMFVPASGFYWNELCSQNRWGGFWSSSLDTWNYGLALLVEFDKTISNVYNEARFKSFPLRGVFE